MAMGQAENLEARARPAHTADHGWLEGLPNPTNPSEALVDHHPLEGSQGVPRWRTPPLSVSVHRRTSTDPLVTSKRRVKLSHGASVQEKEK